MYSLAPNQIFDEVVSNNEIYTKTIRPLVSAFLKGSNITCISYWLDNIAKLQTKDTKIQKTNSVHKMMSPLTTDDPTKLSIIALTINDIFNFIKVKSMKNSLKLTSSESKIWIYASLFSTCFGKVYDLFMNQADATLEWKVNNAGITEIYVQTADELINHIETCLNWYNQDTKSPGINIILQVFYTQTIPDKVDQNWSGMTKTWKFTFINLLKASSSNITNTK